MSNSTPTTCPRCGCSMENRSVDNLCAKCLGELNFTPDTEVPGESAGDSPPPFTPEEVAELFPQLEVLEVLGRGGMGVVYKARQRALGRLVALKLLAPERVADPQFAKRFAHEAQALAALSHPSIVTIHDFGRVGDVYYLLMEFVDGVNLRQAMTAGRFTPEQALAIVPPVCEALQYAHEQGIVHRDIKPENLLLDKSGRVKIADFGIAKMLGAEVDSAARDEGPQSGTLASVAGTPQYMAPEQTNHRVADHRADIYSLGVVLYELLTGELPADKLQPPSRKVQIDVRLDGVVLRALEKSPELRYQSAGEFRTQVETITTHGASAPRVGARSDVGPASFSWTAIAGACLLALGLLSLCLTFFIDEIVARRRLSEEVVLPQRLATSAAPVMVSATAFYAFFATLFGWISVTQIRRSEGRRHGLWLAVLDGLFFPLLALDALLFGVSGAVLFFFRQSSRYSLEPAWLVLFLVGLGVFTVALVVWIDVLVVRAVWRAVRTSASDSKATSATQLNHPELAYVGLVLALVSALAGMAAVLAGPALWLATASSVGIGVLAIIVAWPARKNGLARRAMTIATIGLVIWPLVGLVAAYVRASRLALDEAHAQMAAMYEREQRLALKSASDSSFQIPLVEQPDMPPVVTSEAPPKKDEVKDEDIVVELYFGPEAEPKTPQGTNWTKLVRALNLLPGVVTTFPNSEADDGNVISMAIVRDLSQRCLREAQETKRSSKLRFAINSCLKDAGIETVLWHEEPEASPSTSEFPATGPAPVAEVAPPRSVDDAESTDPRAAVMECVLTVRGEKPGVAASRYVRGICVSRDGLAVIAVPRSSLLEDKPIGVYVPAQGTAKVVAADDARGLTLLRLSVPNQTVFPWIKCGAELPTKGQRALIVRNWRETQEVEVSETGRSYLAGIEGQDGFLVAPLNGARLRAANGSPLVSMNHELQGILLQATRWGLANRIQEIQSNLPAVHVQKLIDDYLKSTAVP